MFSPYQTFNQSFVCTCSLHAKNPNCTKMCFNPQLTYLNNCPTFLERIYADVHHRNRFLYHSIACYLAHPRAVRCSSCRHVLQHSMEGPTVCAPCKFGLNPELSRELEMHNVTLASCGENGYTTGVADNINTV